jgi:hypothetical protein
MHYALRFTPSQELGQGETVTPYPGSQVHRYYLNFRLEVSEREDYPDP